MESYLNDKEEKKEEDKKKEDKEKEDPKKDEKQKDSKEDKEDKKDDPLKHKKPKKPSRKFMFLKGGEFLLKNIENEDMFIPEEFSEDVKEISALVQKFVKKEILPNIGRFESKDYKFMVKMLK